MKRPSLSSIFLLKVGSDDLSGAHIVPHGREGDRFEKVVDLSNMFLNPAMVIVVIGHDANDSPRLKDPMQLSKKRLFK